LLILEDKLMELLRFEIGATTIEKTIVSGIFRV
jgi:hypothetical protein